MNIRIEKVEIISFGKLKNVILDAKPGINILSAPNESGKSTLAAFIKFVFYGFSGTRAQAISENERKLYSPWDGELSAGSVTVDADGTKYTVERRCLASGKENFSITDRATGKLAFEGETPGEALFGVGEEVFARTLFFRQLTLPQGRDDVLADRLQNIAISADEQISTAKAVSKLTEAKNELKNRIGNGIIPKLTKTRDELDRQITESMELRAEAAALIDRSEERAEKLSAGEKKLEELRAERRNAEKYDALLKLRNINRLAEEEKTARASYELAAAGLKNRDGVSDALRELSSINSEYIAEKTRASAAADALNNAESERRALEEAMPITAVEARSAEKQLASKQRAITAFLITAGVLALAGIIVCIAASVPVGVLLLSVAVVFAVLAAAFTAKRAGIARELGFGSVGELKKEIALIPEKSAKLESAKNRVASLRASYEQGFEKCAELKKRLDAGIGKYIDADDGDYSETLDTILTLSTASGEKYAVWKIKKEEFDNASESVDTESLAIEARGAVKPEREKSAIDNELGFYTRQYEQLLSLQRQDELQITSLQSKSGDPALLVGKKNALDEQIRELELRHRAYETAISAINESGDYMKSMVAPRISARADEYFRLATGGKYSAFEVDTRLSMSFGEDFRRSCEYLSAGTRDSAYLCLRLALADMLFGGNAVPMILDDAFVRIDDDRLRMMAHALAESAKTHQIFIFTHSDREMDALTATGAEYSKAVMREPEKPF